MTKLLYAYYNNIIWQPFFPFEVLTNKVTRKLHFTILALKLHISNTNNFFEIQVKKPYLGRQISVVKQLCKNNVPHDQSWDQLKRIGIDQFNSDSWSGNWIELEFKDFELNWNWMKRNWASDIFVMLRRVFYRQLEYCWAGNGVY